MWIKNDSQQPTTWNSKVLDFNLNKKPPRKALVYSFFLLGNLKANDKDWFHFSFSFLQLKLLIFTGETHSKLCHEVRRTILTFVKFVFQLISGTYTRYKRKMMNDWNNNPLNKGRFWASRGVVITNYKVHNFNCCCKPSLTLKRR